MTKRRGAVDGVDYQRDMVLVLVKNIYGEGKVYWHVSIFVYAEVVYGYAEKLYFPISLLCQGGKQEVPTRYTI